MRETEYESQHTSGYDQLPYEPEYGADYLAVGEWQPDPGLESGYPTRYATSQAHQPGSAAETCRAPEEAEPERYFTPDAEYFCEEAPRTAVYGISIPSPAAQTAPPHYDAPTLPISPGPATRPTAASQPEAQPQPQPLAVPRHDTPPQSYVSPQHPMPLQHHSSPEIYASPQLVVSTQASAAPQQDASFQLSASPQHYASPQLCASTPHHTPPRHYASSAPCAFPSASQQLHPAPRSWAPPEPHPSPQHFVSQDGGDPPPPERGVPPAAPPAAGCQPSFAVSAPSLSRRFPELELYPADLRPMLTRHRLRRRRHRTAASMLTGAALAFGVSALRPWTALTSDSATLARGPTLPSADARVRGMPNSIGLSDTRARNFGENAGPPPKVRRLESDVAMPGVRRHRKGE